jgi:hypothetical protein
MSSTPVAPAAETPQQKLAREVAEFSARKIADAKFEQEQARLKAEQEAYAASPEGQRAAARARELLNQEARAFIQRHSDFSTTPENIAKITDWLVANKLPENAENLSKAYESLWKDGKLTPKPYAPPPADAPKPFDTRGLTIAKIHAMPADEYRRLIASPSGKAIVDYVLGGGK